VSLGLLIAEHWRRGSRPATRGVLTMDWDPQQRQAQRFDMINRKLPVWQFSLAAETKQIPNY